jgi:Uma2 family endonuclease
VSKKPSPFGALRDSALEFTAAGPDTGATTLSTVAQISIEQYDRMIASGVFEGPHRRRIELIHGDLRMMSPIGPCHEDTVDILDEWSHDVAPRDQVRVRIQNSIGVLSLVSVPEPDVAWVRRQSYRKARPTGKNVWLLIEVARSSLEYDRGEKAELYAAAGIKDYWVVNLVDRCVEVFRDPHRGRYRSLQTYHIGDEVHPLAFPKITLAVATLFPE